MLAPVAGADCNRDDAIHVAHVGDCAMQIALDRRHLTQISIDSAADSALPAKRGRLICRLKDMSLCLAPTATYLPSAGTSR